MRDKKGISEIVGYVILVVIAISLSITVYMWMKNMVPTEGKSCPEGVSISIEDYFCDEANDKINITLKNNGRFKLRGVLIKVGNSSSETATYSLKENIFGTTIPELQFDGGELLPGNKSSKLLSYSDVGEIAKISIQPFIYDEEIILCDAHVISQKISGCS